jgi:hypothetical protein
MLIGDCSPVVGVAPPASPGDDNGCGGADAPIANLESVLRVHRATDVHRSENGEDVGLKEGHHDFEAGKAYKHDEGEWQHGQKQ